jgi:hypothetical protein
MPDIIYTGKGLAPQISQESGKAMSRLSDFITRAEELKYQAFKQNEQEFLKNSNIDPAFFISKANQETQIKMLDDFNRKWAERMKSSGNNLSVDDKMAMQAEKNYIISQQQEMQTRQDLWRQHRDMIMQNPNKYDAQEWSIYDAKYREKGEYPLIAPPIKAKSIDMAIEDNPVVGNENTQTIPETRDGLRGFVDVRFSGDEQQGRERVKQVALMDEAYSKDLVTQFSNLDEATKLKYLDADKNGLISPQEAEDFNAIIKWGQDTKWQKALRRDELGWRKTEPTPSRTFNWNVNIGVGHNRNSEFDKKENINLWNTDFKEYYDLDLGVARTVTQKIQDYTDLQTGERLKLNKTARFKVVAYSPDNDQLIVSVIDTVVPTSEERKMGAKPLMRDKVIALDASLYDDLLRSKPYGFSREAALGRQEKQESSSLPKKKIYDQATGTFK